MEILDGKKISKDILESIKKDVALLPFVPTFCDILVGEDPSSVQYVNLKKKKAESLGFRFHDATFPASITTLELLTEIQKINQIDNMCGIIVQLPLPAHIDTKRVLDAINPELDVDCLGEVQIGHFYSGGTYLVPPTALACMRILEELHLDLTLKSIVVLGQGKLVGRPLVQLLENQKLNFQALDNSTINNESIIKNADIIITGIGRGKYLTKDMVKDGVIIIDAGTSEEGGSIVGDVDFESVKGLASYITPVPGGVGPVTVSMLFQNVLKVAKQRNDRVK